MTATIINGNQVAKHVREDVAKQVATRTALGHTIGLAAVLVGDDPASHVYVDWKERDCEQVGMVSHGVRLPATTTQHELHQAIQDLNDNPEVHGIIVQMPLPDHLDEALAQEQILPSKDVDGLHSSNQGELLRGEPKLVPATPAGCEYLLRHYNIPLSGANVVVVGRSTLVGRPLVALLSRKGVDCTVTNCHSRTTDLSYHTKQADIVIMAVGVPGLLTGDMIKPGAVVLDVGITRAADDKLVGDVDFESVSQVASHITPVPGGIGPMTRAMLLVNTLNAATMQQTANINNT